jgi:thiol-disulfide isomerase/thioredoxin
LEPKYAALKALLDSFDNQFKFPPEFLNYEKARLTLAQANEKMMYPRYHQYYTKVDDVELPDGYYSFTADVDLNNKVYWKMDEFNSYLDYLINHKTKELLENDKRIANRNHSSTFARLKVLPDLVSDTEELNKRLYKTMASHVAYSDITNIDSLQHEFNLLCTDSTYIAKIDESLKSWETLAPGMPAPDFSCIDMSGKEYKLSDFLGKYVYLDIWATWCGPCRREIPELEKMHDEYAGKNISIISISIDNTQAPWKKMVSEDEMKGMQMYAEGAWKSDVAKLYMVRSIPRFILIGPDGKIINVKAPRPSGNIREVLDSYNI